MQKLLAVLMLLLLFSCNQESKTKSKFSFYHWKAKAELSKSYQQAIETTNTETIYLHYFDIEAKQKKSWSNDGIYPTYVLKSVDSSYQNFDIIPVVYITNAVFKTQDLDVSNLSNRIRDLIHQISERHFNKKIKHIQIDCDWSGTTKNNYFELLQILGNEFDIDVTIRLHQIKFKEKTGVPRVKKGTLMLYNVGDLKNKNQNSILEEAIVKQYINTETSYPLPLNIGLPLFSQTILFNQENKIKIIKDTHRSILETDSHFKQIDNNNFKVVNDTLFKGFYLSKGYNLKLEETAASTIVESYAVIKKSALQTNEIIFYHLDETSLSNIDIKSLIKKL